MLGPQREDSARFSDYDESRAEVRVKSQCGKTIGLIARKGARSALHPRLSCGEDELVGSLTPAHHEGRGYAQGPDEPVHARLGRPTLSARV